MTSPTMSSSLLVIASATIVVVGLSLLHILSKDTTLPPGPKPRLFTGNLHQIPRRQPYRVYRDWSKIYGKSRCPVIYFHVFGRKFIILNSYKSITDLIEKRSSKYSTRPRYIMGGELVGRDDTSILFMKYGPKWKHGRQLLHRWLSARNLEGYTPLQYEASCRTLKALLNDPDHFAENIKASVGSIILRITYGIDCKPRDDPWIAMADRTIEITAIASKPGRWLVDSFPILKYVPPFFPGASFIRWARKSRHEVFEQIRLPFEYVKGQVLKGSPTPCFVAEQLTEDWNNLQGAAEQHALACAAGSLYAGGIETVVSTIRLLLLVMITYPEIQRRAQREVDTIIGSQRLATIEDRSALPYLGCIIKETLRHSSTVPLVPHSLDEDDVYEGHRIPRGSCVMVNIWAILNDPSIYRDPETFNPDRFAGPEPELDPSTISFAIGLGRRFCPGSHFALSIVFVMTAHLLSVFDILPPLDENGLEYIPPMDFIDTHTRKIAPFRCRILPRDTEKVCLVESALKNLGQAQRGLS